MLPPAGGDQNQGWELLTVWLSLTVVAGMLVLGRLYSRLFVVRGCCLDDGFIGLAIVSISQMSKCNSTLHWDRFQDTGYYRHNIDRLQSSLGLGSPYVLSSSDDRVPHKSHTRDQADLRQSLHLLIGITFGQGLSCDLSAAHLWH